MDNIKNETIEVCVHALKSSAHIVPDESTEFFPDINIVNSMLESSYAELKTSGKGLTSSSEYAYHILDSIAWAFTNDSQPHMASWFNLARDKIKKTTCGVEDIKLNLSNKIIDKIFHITNFIPNILINMLILLWTWFVMVCLLIFKGRSSMDIYQKAFMEAPPLTFKQYVRWNFLLAIIIIFLMRNILIDFYFG